METEILLLSFIAGLLAVDIFFKHAVNKNGESLSFNDLTSLLFMILLASGIFYGLAYLFTY